FIAQRLDQRVTALLPNLAVLIPLPSIQTLRKMLTSHVRTPNSIKVDTFHPPNYHNRIGADNLDNWIRPWIYCSRRKNWSGCAMTTRSPRAPFDICLPKSSVIGSGVW